MSKGAIRGGWRVYREQRVEFLDLAKVRRRTRVGALVVLAAAALLVFSAVHWDIFDGPPARDAVAIVFFSAAVACLVMAFIPVADPSTAPNSRRMLGNWRRSERIDRHFAKNPPEIMPEDRDEVIAGSKGLLAASVVAVDRSIWVPCGYVLVWVALVVAGLASAEHLNLLLLPLIFAALQSATVLTSVVAAGRADTAHDRALALPPAPVDSSPVKPKSRPTGSMLALPDE